MKKYFKLKSDNYVNYGIQRAPKMGEQSVMLGRPVDQNQLPPLVFEHDFPLNEPIPHYLTGGTVLVSKRLINLLGRIGINNYQVFQALLINPETGDQRKDYYLFNVLGLMEVARLKTSGQGKHRSGIPEADNLIAFNDPALKGKTVYDADLFRLAEDPVSIMVSERIVNSMKNNKPEGGWGIVIEESDTY